jgi:ABC-2 type transport system permease protein
MNQVRTLIDKEWAEIFKNRTVILMMLLMPLLLSILPLVMLRVMGASLGEMSLESTGIPSNAMAICTGMTGGECMQAYMMGQFMVMFLLMPVMIPVTIASYSIVGEKNMRSLEPLLATPISTIQLLLGKGLAAVIPAILAGWLSFGIFVAGSYLIGLSPVVRAYLLSPTWLLVILILGPILSLISVNLALWVSSRVNDPRIAEQISGVIILPVMLFAGAQMAGLVVMSVTSVLIALLVALLIAIGLTYLGVLVFQRETILTRWK